jgi:hypothetical protein
LDAPPAPGAKEPPFFQAAVAKPPQPNVCQRHEKPSANRHRSANQLATRQAIPRCVHMIAPCGGDSFAWRARASLAKLERGTDGGAMYPSRISQTDLQAQIGEIRPPHKAGQSHLAYSPGRGVAAGGTKRFALGRQSLAASPTHHAFAPSGLRRGPPSPRLGAIRFTHLEARVGSRI